MISPHTEIGNVEAWVTCAKCNNAKHRVLPGEKTPYWLCQDERCELKLGQEIEVEYIETQADILYCR